MDLGDPLGQQRGGLLLPGGTADDPLGMRLVGPAAGLAVFVALLSFRGYRLPEAASAETVPVRR